MKTRNILLVALVIAFGIVSLSATALPTKGAGPGTKINPAFLVHTSFAGSGPSATFTGALAQSPGSSTSLVASLPDPGASAICYSIRFYRGHLIIDWIDPMMQVAREYLSNELSAVFTTVGKLMPWLVVEWRLPQTAPALERRTIDTPLHNLL